MKAGGLMPYTQAFIYKVFCLSKFLYGLEIMSLNKKTIKLLNMEQNTLIRYIIGCTSIAISLTYLSLLDYCTLVS